MNNPLLQKYEELYGKKEPPKMPRIEDYEGEETIADELKKLVKLTTYDWIATAKFLRESVSDANGNWAKIPIDMLLDIAEELEKTYGSIN